jgi:glycosyltransferase involved in cell wall biosynthesis
MTSWKNVVLIPCKDEELAVAQVVSAVKKISPQSRVVVIDNGSTDRTAFVAEKAGAEVLRYAAPGKGRALCHALERISADSYTFVDGDGTYDLSRLPEMIQAVRDGAAMATGVRRTEARKAFPRFHRFGNFLFTQLISLLFRKKVQDVLSGLRVLSHDFVSYSPLTVHGFEVEAYYTLESLVRDLPYEEFEIGYGVRPPGSASKLRSFRDGFKILWCIFDLFRMYRPLAFFGFFSTACFALSLLSGWQPISEFLQEGYVYAVPRAVLAAALMNLSFVLSGLGLILSSQMRFHLRNLEIHRFQKQRRLEVQKEGMRRVS